MPVDARERFVALVTGDGFEHSGGLVLERASWEEFSLCLRLRVKPDDDAPAQAWIVRVRRSFHERLKSEWAEHVYVGRDHPALIPYTQLEGDLFFTGNTLPAREIRGVVGIACQAELGEWHPASGFLNKSLGLNAGRCGPHGLLGRFPQSVSSRIAQELVGEPIHLSVVNERAPAFWDGTAWVRYPDAAEVLVFGSSFVVGEGFRFEAA